MKQKEYNQLLWGTIAYTFIITAATIAVAYNIGKIVALSN
jgi:hypothetical protein